MAQHMCEICEARPASVRVTVIQNGQRKQLDVCDYHYAQLSRHQRALSSLESLFRGGLLDDFFSASGNEPSAPRSSARRGPAQEREALNLEQHFSGQAKEILQRAEQSRLRCDHGRTSDTRLHLPSDR